MDNNLPPLPRGFEALGNTPGVMREAASHVRDLAAAVARLSDSLITVGLPSREWRAEKAYLNILVRAMPPTITLGAYISRLTDFARTDGLGWLRGGQRELDRFSDEVATLYKVTRALHDASRDLRGGPADPQGGVSLAQAFSHPRTVASLDGVGEILADLDALAPYMRPVPLGIWADEPAAVWPAMAEGETGASGALGSATAAAPTGVKGKLGVVSVASALALARQLGGRFRALPRQVRWSSLAAVPLLVVLIVSLVALAHRPPHGGSPVTDSALRTSPTATPTATAVPTHAPTPLPAVKFTLSCKVHSFVGTVTLRNTSAVAITWVATPPAPFSATPASGTLTAGASVTVKIASGTKSPAGVVVPVKAAHGAVTASSSVTC